MSNQRRYVDLDFNFFANPVNDDVSKKIDDNAIKQSIRNLILMKKYDSPFHPDLCSQVQDSLFEIINPLTASIIKRAVTYTLENFEPRIELISVDVVDVPDRNRVDIAVVYKIKATGITSTYHFAVNKTR